MIKLGFNGHYRTLHLSNELGNTIIGGVATHCNEHYRHRNGDSGFLHYRDKADLDFEVEDYTERKDIAIVTEEDGGKIADLNFDIIVVHFFELIRLITERLLQHKKMVYVVHSVPTPEPTPRDHVFGGHFEVEQKVKTLCQYAHVVVCVSNCEARKLAKIFPEYASKITVIHNGLTMPEGVVVVPPSRKLRLGFMARMDYRKGLLETIKVIRDLDVELHVATNVGDRVYYLPRINEFLDATGIRSKVHWHGFCVGARKQAFFDYVDAMLVPSLYEPFCYVPLEAVAAGKPVIVANNGGTAEIVGKDYAYQFNPYLPGDYAKVLRQFLDDSPETVVEKMNVLLGRLPLFSGKLMVDKYHALLETL